MQFVVATGIDPAHPARSHDAWEILAAGEMIVFEGQWPAGACSLLRAPDTASAAEIEGISGFAVAGLNEAGAGRAFAIGAHRMRDPEGFAAYAARVPDVVQGFRGRFLARGGKVTAIGGELIPDRAVIIEFPTAEDAVAFYVSDAYAPLLAIRHRTTDPRFGIMARSGRLPAGVRARAGRYLSARRGAAH